MMKNAEGDNILVRGGKNKTWNYHPDLPISNSPIFRWPLRTVFILSWLKRTWLNLSATTIWILLAIIVHNLFQPSLADWIWKDIGFMFLRNLCLISCVAGGLHFLLWYKQIQGSNLRFDSRVITKRSRVFTFNNQVLDNIFWSVTWGVPIWTLYEIIYFRYLNTGSIPVLQLNENPLWFVFFFWVILLWKGLHFYWIHRFLHWPRLYSIAHSVHHRNLNTGPWSGLSMHPIETLLYLSGLLIHLVIPTHPVHFLFHVYALTLNPALSHSGFDALIIRNKRRLELGEFFHQLHHRYFECNYGTPEMPWDKWFNTFHDGTEKYMARGQKEKRNPM